VWFAGQVRVFFRSFLAQSIRSPLRIAFACYLSSPRSCRSSSMGLCLRVLAAVGVLEASASLGGCPEASGLSASGAWVRIAFARYRSSPRSCRSSSMGLCLRVLAAVGVLEASASLGGCPEASDLSASGAWVRIAFACYLSSPRSCRSSSIEFRWSFVGSVDWAGCFARSPMGWLCGSLHGEERLRVI